LHECSGPSASFTKEALEAMLAHDWPGNIRELKSFVERAALISEGEKIEASDLVFSPTIL
jgi:DNA-binding NtrC family response regulator